MTTSFIDIKFYIVHCLFMVAVFLTNMCWLKQKLIRARSVCNIERAPYFITIQLQLRPIN